MGKRARHLLILALSLMTWACQAPYRTSTTPEVAAVVEEPTPEVVTRALPSQLHTTTLFDRPVVRSSIRSASDGQRVLVAFETRSGDVFAGLDARPRRMARRAQVGCVAALPDGTGFVLAVYERTSGHTASTLVLYTLNALGERVATRRNVTQPDLWMDPGSGCALVPTGRTEAPLALVARARRATPEAVLDMWYVPMDNAAHPLEVGLHVPRIEHVVPRDAGALLILSRVRVLEAPRKGKEQIWEPVHVDDRGQMVPALLTEGSTDALVVDSYKAGGLHLEMDGRAWRVSRQGGPVEVNEVDGDTHGTLETSLHPAQLHTLDDGERVVVGTGPDDDRLRDVAQGVLVLRGWRGTDALKSDQAGN